MIISKTIFAPLYLNFEKLLPPHPLYSTVQESCNHECCIQFINCSVFTFFVNDDRSVFECAF